MPSPEEAERLVRGLAWCEGLIPASEEARALIRDARWHARFDDEKPSALHPSFLPPLVKRLGDAYHEWNGSVGVTNSWHSIFRSQLLKPEPLSRRLEMLKDIQAGKLPDMVRRHGDALLARGAALYDALVEAAEVIQARERGESKPP